MGIFDIWSPGPKKQEQKAENKEPRHSLPGPAGEPAKPKPKTIKDLFSFATPKEPKETKKPEPRGSLLDALIPESERGDIYEAPPEPFRHERQERPSSSFRRSEPAPSQFRGRQQTWTLPSPEELSKRLTEIFNLDEIFSRLLMAGIDWFPGIENISWGSAYRTVSLVPVAPVDDYDVLGAFFGIPRSVIDSYIEVPQEQAVAATDALWNDILWPLLDMTTAAFEFLKPPELPGWFQLGPGRKDPGILELSYNETV